MWRQSTWERERSRKKLIHLHAFQSPVKHVRQASFEFAEVYYNRQKIQKGLGYLTPSES